MMTLALALALSTPAHAGPAEVHASEALEALEALDLEGLDDLDVGLEGLEELEVLGDALEGLGEVVTFEPGGDLSILGDLVVVRDDGVEVAGVVDIREGQVDILGVVVVEGETVRVAGVTLAR